MVTKSGISKKDQSFYTRTRLDQVKKRKHIKFGSNCVQYSLSVIEMMPTDPSLVAGYPNICYLGERIEKVGTKYC